MLLQRVLERCPLLRAFPLLGGVLYWRLGNTCAPVVTCTHCHLITPHLHVFTMRHTPQVIYYNFPSCIGIYFVFHLGITYMNIWERRGEL